MLTIPSHLRNIRHNSRALGKHCGWEKAHLYILFIQGVQKRFMLSLGIFWRRQNLGLSYYRHYAYYPRSSYCEHINNFQRLFSRVHICKFEELIEEPEKALHKIHKLLGVNSYIEEQFSRLHANSSATYRFSFVNSLLNKVEDKVGVTKPKGYLLRINFKKYTYPKISVEEREFVVRELRNICPEVMKDYGYC